MNEIIIDDTFGYEESNRYYIGYSPSLRSQRCGLKTVVCNKNIGTGYMSEKDNGYRIRKLTPRECWRLMDFADEDFDKAKAAGISNSQLYKQAGNSIVVSVPYFIFKELYKAMPYLFEDLKVSSYFSGIGAIEKALDRLYEDINQNENGGTETEFTPGQIVM